MKFQSTLPGWGATLPFASLAMVSFQFQSTLPGWGATSFPTTCVTLEAFQSTLPGWGATAAAAAEVAQWALFQSTLPGWGATAVRALSWWRCRNFNPRSPDGERPEKSLDVEISDNFNPRSPDGERPVADRYDRIEIVISIHAPRMGSDRENGHLRPRYGQNHPFSTLIVSQIVVDVLGTVRKSQKTPAH